MVELWTTVMGKIQIVESFNSKYLAQLETLLVAGLSSRHKAIVNVSLTFWNDHLSLVEGLTYPEALVMQLVRLSSIANVNLANLPSSVELQEVCQSPTHILKSC